MTMSYGDPREQTGARAAMAAAPGAVRDSGHIYGMDLMRFAAAMMVVLYHLGTYGAVTPAFDPPATQLAFPGLAALTWAGWVGVQVFFVISGYVISASLRQGTVGRFAGKRVVRILPTLWICATFALLIRLTWGEPVGDLLGDWARALFLSPKGPYIDGVVWTLVVEAVFYVVIGLAVWLAVRFGLSRMRVLDVGALLLALASCAFLALFILSAIQAPALHATLSWFGFKVVLLHHGVFFAAGMALSATHRAGESLLRNTTFRLALTFAVGEIWVKAGMEMRALYPLLVFLGMVLLLDLSVRRNARIRKLPIAGPSPVLGLMSYPIYLCHFTLGMYLVPLLDRHFGSTAPVVGITLALTLALAWAIARGPEPWLQARLRRVLVPARSARDAGRKTG